jgi:hypothetical protein
MEHQRPRRVGTMIVILLVAGAPSLCAQGLEIAPFGGYRFGSDPFVIVGDAVDIDGAPAVGLVFDVPTSNGFQIEGLFTHQQADIQAIGAPTRWRIAVDHFQVGGLQEYDVGLGRARPFTTGVLGLTRYAAEADTEVRFTVGAGGGLKLFPSPHLGVRLESRVFATFLDADTRAIACSRGTCIYALHVDVAWQAEFTAGMVVRFP